MDRWRNKLRPRRVCWASGPLSYFPTGITSQPGASPGLRHSYSQALGLFQPYFDKSIFFNSQTSQSETKYGEDVIEERDSRLHRWEKRQMEFLIDFTHCKHPQMSCQRKLIKIYNWGLPNSYHVNEKTINKIKTSDKTKIIITVRMREETTYQL